MTPAGMAATAPIKLGAVKHFLLSAAVSCLMTLWLVHLCKARIGGFLDRDFAKPQKMHVSPVPRVGGIGIFCGMLASAVLLLYWHGREHALIGLLLMACALPTFVSGVLQDFTDTLSPRGRLMASALSAVLAYFVLGAAIRATDIPGLDWVVSFGIGSLALTVFTVAGIAHAINIIDGLNGLASMCVVIMLTAVSYVAFEVGDPLIGTLALAGIGAVLGFFIWNFPAGLIFLGDGGAYFLGFLVAELSILLLVRNPEVSPLFPLLTCIYPVFETLFSIYRRRFLRAMPPQLPDGIHLHSLLYRRVMRWAVGDRSAKALTRRNSMTSPVLWALCMASILPALLFWDNTPALMAFLLLFGISYVLLYWRIVRFRSPRLLRILGSRPVPLDEGDNPRT